MWDRYQFKLGKKAKKLPVEGIQTESGSHDTPTSEQSGLTIDQRENESTGSIGSIFLFTFSIWLISSNQTKMINSEQNILLKLLSADQIFFFCHYTTSRTDRQQHFNVRIILH